VEANTSQRQWFIPCCRSLECPKCKGSGRIYPERCPIHYYDDEIKTLRYLYENYTFKNILPYSGSPIEQPKVIFETFDTIDHYLSVFRTMREEQKEDNREMTSKIKARLRGG